MRGRGDEKSSRVGRLSFFLFGPTLRGNVLLSVDTASLVHASSPGNKRQRLHGDAFSTGASCEGTLSQHVH